MECQDDVWDLYDTDIREHGQHIEVDVRQELGSEPSQSLGPL